jgi:hypothetical protein
LILIVSLSLLDDSNPDQPTQYIAANPDAVKPAKFIITLMKVDERELSFFQ